MLCEMDLSSTVRAKLEKICQCGVCLETLKNPKVLQCQHIFCQKCLMLSCTQNRMGLMSLFCPTCRQRQPLVFQQIDVAKLQTPFFVNQILEIIQDWTRRLKYGELKKVQDKLQSPDYLNTKITSVFTTVNMDTLEEMTQIRTDEYGLQSVKLKELEDEIAISRKINSELLVDNHIMKARLQKQNRMVLNQNLNDSLENAKTPSTQSEDERKKDGEDTDLSLLKHTRDVRERLYKYVTRKDKNGIKKQEEHFKIDEYKSERDNNHPRNNLSRDINGPQTFNTNNQNKESTKVVLKNEGEVREKMNGSSIQNGDNSLVGSMQNRGTFCWRCMRRGHNGSQCKEQTTILGRRICPTCGQAGHSKCSYL